ncbi:GDSL-type esterase/lipase family protein [Flavihumibacter sp. RY-1]|uniref:GDSL-type esterase/lipase family protein n=1 Tax=Flavihumibacter fluminis TaxID=2909236 RepID=A0ABS9BKW4_9BACT|nr:GDSL-type esterase/lipase family protein [Flavihumibacter fluminis]MCF1716339.1 GDSL-type esterase/lipase family protein [Flavihumibacter fluminis]
MVSILVANSLYGQQPKSIIACIGNSITFGARLDDPSTDSYPAIVAKTLMDKGFTNYEVLNFGIGGATMLRYGKPNLWRLLDSINTYKPDIMLIKAGTNETVSEPLFNWEQMKDFEADYNLFIDSVKKMIPNCTIILCSPLDMVLNTPELSKERFDNLTLRRPRIWELRDRVSKIAAAAGLYFLDLTPSFSNKPEYMTVKDGVHPNKKGYAYLGHLAADYLIRNKIVLK